LGAKIKVIGVGGGGGNAVNTMIAAGLSGVDFLAANTDLQALQASLSPNKIQLGKQLTQGLGAGANPEVGREAALEDVQVLREYLTGADMVFVTAGMGGGTGTGGAPVIARIARELGALTVAVVTRPFTFEGKKRMRQAEDGITLLKEAVDTLITIPNQRLLAVSGRDSSLLNAFKKADDILLHAVRGISDLITVHGLINLDFADVRAIMAEMGMAMMGAGIASGENRAIEAAQKAISSPLLNDVSIHGARGVLINITGGSDLSLHEVSEAASLIQGEADEDANIIFGAVVDETITDEIRITVIATGFPEEVFDQQLRPNASQIVRREPERAQPQVQPPAPAPRERVSAPEPRERPLAQTQAESRASVLERIPRDCDNPRPVVRLGTIVDSGPEPMLTRTISPEAPVPPRTARTEEFTLSEEAEDAYEIPAFLRKSVG
jgi:cell division protein FtsZ